MNILFDTIPTLFGRYHILALVLIILFNTYFYFFVKDKNEEYLINLLHRFGLFMMILEIFKQLFCFEYVFDRVINLWFFPFQICSLAMYFSFVVKYLDKDKQNIILVFFVTYSTLTDFVALLLPLDMLRIQVPLFIHSFAFHGLIISEIIIAYLILKRRSNYNFKNTLYFFCYGFYCGSD